MANILLRSPQYIPDNESGASYATLELTVNGLLRYTITNNTDASGNVLFEISELSRDYLDVIYDGTYNSFAADISATVTFYDTEDVQVGTPSTTTHKGFDGYGDFLDGDNPVVNPNTIMQSNIIVYVPEGATGQIPYESSGAIAYATFGSSSPSLSVAGTIVTIRRICEPKYTPIKVTFVNKFGALQDVYFYKKHTKSISVEREMYKSNIISSTGTYQTYNHNKRNLKSVGAERITANTGFLCNNMNEPMKQLMLSEQMWATIENNVIPINITNSDFTYKTSVNDKLINYTMEFEYAFDAINNIR